MYSASLTDLGQTSSPPVSNVVASASTLQHFSSNFSAINTASVLYYTQIETQDFDARKDSDHPTGPLGLTPSVISTEYLCQIPKRRPIGQIFIAVLLADLVLLQAAWKLYTFSVEQYLLRQRDSAKFCEGHTHSNIIRYKDAKGGVIMYATQNSEEHIAVSFNRAKRAKG